MQAVYSAQLFQKCRAAVTHSRLPTRNVHPALESAGNIHLFYFPQLPGIRTYSGRCWENDFGNYHDFTLILEFSFRPVILCCRYSGPFRIIPGQSGIIQGYSTMIPAILFRFSRFFHPLGVILPPRISFISIPSWLFSPTSHIPAYSGILSRLCHLVDVHPPVCI